MDSPSTCYKKGKIHFWVKTLKLTHLKRIDWKKHSFIKQDSDDSEDEDLYFRQTNDSRKQSDSKLDQKSGQKSDQRVQVQQPDEIDTDDEINEVLDQKAKVEPEKIEPEKVEPEKVEEEEVERIIRDTPKKGGLSVNEKVTYIFYKPNNFYFRLQRRYHERII